MPNFWLKVKVWTKVTLFSLIVIYSLFFIAKNSDKPVSFWYWYGRTFNTSLLFFTFLTFLAGMLIAILTRTIYKTASQVRELRQRGEQERRDRELRELQTKAAMLQTRPAVDPAATAPPVERHDET